MCGIAGIIDFNRKQVSEAVLRRMIAMIVHRGPDAHGIYAARGVGLASTRLSIIDLNTGNQPIHSEDKSLWVVLNGEIYNYPELRSSLVSKGHTFYTKSDTEVLVHLYEDEGPEMLERLNGQFAMALWDTQKRRLFIARDRVGIRPLFYHLRKGRLVFGSEIKALFADRSIPRELDLQTISDIFTCWAPLGGATAFKGIEQLPAGHYALFTENGLQIKEYWTSPFLEDREIQNKPPACWAEDLKGLLKDAIRIRLRADVPVGAYLSGGLDSTLITTLVKRDFNNRLATFSVNFSNSSFDEAYFQRKAVSTLSTEHSWIRCKEEDIGSWFQKVVWHTEVPILRTAPGPLFLLSGLVREKGYKVVLTGEGADEFFGGYNIFKEEKVRRFWARYPDSRLRPRLLERLYPYVFRDGNGKNRAFVRAFFRQNLSDTESVFYSHLLRWKNTSQLHELFSSDLKAHASSLNEFLERCSALLPDGFSSWHPMARTQYLEISIFMTNYLLSSQGDRMAMAHSVEGRFPYLDHRVMEYASKIPPWYRIKVLNEKFILKQIARDLIPFELVKRPKQPYRAPGSACFLGPKAPEYAMELLSKKRIQDKGYFDPGKVGRLVQKCMRQNGHLRGERENMAVVGILSTHLLDELFIKNFPTTTVEPAEIRVFTQENEPARGNGESERPL